MSTVVDIPAVVANVNAIGIAKQALADASTKQAIALAATLSQPEIKVAISTTTMPTAPTVDTLAGYQVTSDFNYLRGMLNTQLVSIFAPFFSTYFPIGNELTDAIAWVDNAILNGGSGMRPAVEGALWDRARGRILADNTRMQDEIMTTWAARRYSLPPGAAAFEIMVANLDASGKIADVSRDTSIEAFKQEMANITFAVQTAVSYRSAAMAASAEYIKNMVIAPAVAVAGIPGDAARAKVQAQEMLVQLFSATVQEAVSSIGIAVSTAQLNIQAAELTQKVAIEKVSLSVQAAMAAAQSAGNQAAAALNAIHAQLGWNLNDSRDLTGTF